MCTQIINRTYAFIEEHDIHFHVITQINEQCILIR